MSRGHNELILPFSTTLYINPCGAHNRIFWDNECANAMAADALASFIARSSVATVLMV